MKDEVVVVRAGGRASTVAMAVAMEAAVEAAMEAAATTILLDLSDHRFRA